MVLWRVPIFAMLCKGAVLMLWPASLFLGLIPVGLSPFFSLLIGGDFHCISFLQEIVF
jgi:hypothetical protein